MPIMRTLYYLSQTEIDLLTPTAQSKSADNIDLPKICFSTSIQGGLTRASKAINPIGQRFKVYVVETDQYYAPTLSMAPEQKITEEVWIQTAVEPDYLYDIEVTGENGTKFVDLGEEMRFVPQWQYTIVDTLLTEDTRTLLVSKSRNVGPYKNQMRGKNRFERKKHSQIAKTVKQYNKIDMNKVFKEDILEVAIPIVGETDNYTVNIKLEGVIKEIARNIKNNQNKLEYKTIIQSLTKVFNTGNVWVKCSCPDYKYRFAHWNIINKVSVDDTSKDPGPGKGIRNPNDNLGRGCKHVLLCLANGDWLMKVASVLNNYIHYAEEKLQKPFLKLIFPKLYGVPFEEASDHNILPDDFELDSSESIIDAINDWGKNRGKYRPGTNKNPVTGTGGRNETKATDKNTSAADSKNTSQADKKAEGTTEPAKAKNVTETQKNESDEASED